VISRAESHRPRRVEYLCAALYVSYDFPIIAIGNILKTRGRPYTLKWSVFWPQNCRVQSRGEGERGRGPTFLPIFAALRAVRRNRNGHGVVSTGGQRDGVGAFLLNKFRILLWKISETSSWWKILRALANVNTRHIE